MLNTCNYWRIPPLSESIRLLDELQFSSFKLVWGFFLKFFVMTFRLLLTRIKWFPPPRVSEYHFLKYQICFGIFFCLRAKAIWYCPEGWANRLIQDCVADIMRSNNNIALTDIHLALWQDLMPILFSVGWSVAVGKNLFWERNGL